MSLNIANAVLILGVLWIYFTYELNIIVTFLLIGYAVVMWSYHGFSDERGDLMKAQAELYKSRARYYDRRKK